MTGMLEKTYSNALFQLALEKDSLETVYTEFMEVSGILKDNEDYLKLLSLPIISEKSKNECLSLVFKDKVSELFYDFMLVLIKNRTIRDFFKIADEFRELYNNEHGILEITAITAMPLSDELGQKLKSKLLTVSGKKITLHNKIDKGIIGGIVLEYNNSQIDASIKSSIDAMRAKINSIIA